MIFFTLDVDKFATQGMGLRHPPQGERSVVCLGIVSQLLPKAISSPRIGGRKGES